jgi:HEAT repeat protein
VTANVLVGDMIEIWRPGGSVPILLAMADWNPMVPLRKWVADELRGQHRWLSGRLASRLVDEGQVVAVLDGFDEMPSHLRADAVRKLNTAAAEGLPIVVTSRRAQYVDAVTGIRDPLDRALVITLKPVDAGQVEQFLTKSSVDGGHRWKQIVAHLRKNPDGNLSRLLGTPLMAHMARTVYSNSAVHPNVLLGFATDAEIERHLLNAYIPALYGVGSGAADRARRWLSKLAGRLNRHGSHTFSPGSLPIHVPVWASVLRSIAGIPFLVLFYITYLCLALLGAAVGFVVAPILTLVYLARLSRFMTPRQIGFWLLIGAASPLIGLAGGAATFGMTGFLFFGFLGLQTGEAIGRFGIHIGLAIRGEIPWRWRRFIRDAHQRGILRWTRSGYEFRHLRIQDYLAGTVGEPSCIIEPDSDVAVLKRLGDHRSRDVLAAMASDRSSRECFVAAAALVEMGDPRGPEAMVAIAMSPDGGSVHLLAALALTHLDDARGPDLLASIAADDKRMATRCDAADVLIRLGDPRGEQMLVKLASNTDVDQQTRIRGAAVLAIAGHSYGRDALAQYVVAFEGPARRSAAEALLKLGDPRGCDSLVAIAADLTETSEHRLSVAKMLARFEPARGRSSLAALAGDTNMLPEHRMAAHRVAKKLRRHGAFARTKTGLLQ